MNEHRACSGYAHRQPQGVVGEYPKARCRPHVGWTTVGRPGRAPVANVEAGMLLHDGSKSTVNNSTDRMRRRTATPGAGTRLNGALRRRASGALVPVLASCFICWSCGARDHGPDDLVLGVVARVRPEVSRVDDLPGGAVATRVYNLHSPIEKVVASIEGETHQVSPFKGRWSPTHPGDDYLINAGKRGRFLVLIRRGKSGGDLLPDRSYGDWTTVQILHFLNRD